MRSFFALLCLLMPLSYTHPALAEPTHGIAMHGSPALGPNESFGFVNKKAPKGGRTIVGFVGSYDNLNPFIPRGQGVAQIRTLVYEQLMIRNFDEPFSLYGLIAEKVDLPEDRKSITFFINPKAKFADGKQITADDVIFSWQTIKEKGGPNLRNNYGKVETVDRINDLTVRFNFPNANDRELPLILGLMAVLPKHAIDPVKFEQTTLEPPLASGPYRVVKVDQGNQLVLQKNPDWWAKDLPITQGYYNFDEIRYEFYRDNNSMFEAFKKGLIDFRTEDDTARWATGYDFPARQEGKVVLDTYKSGLPRTLTGYAFNTRRPHLQDKNVRRALITLFDFEWMNANLFSSAYERTESIYQNSELSALGRAADEKERAIIQEVGAEIEPAILEGKYHLPKSDGSGLDRNLLKQAVELFKKAGWVRKDNQLVKEATGEPFTLEVMISTKEHERVMLAYKRMLDAVGVGFSIRLVDSAQFERRRQNYDFDMMPWIWPSSLSPGNEQVFRWSSKVADQPSSFNLSGVKNPAADKVLDKMLAARTREDLVSASRVFDRIMMDNAYVLSLYHLPGQRLARWTHIKIPEKIPLQGIQLDSWWTEADDKK